MTKTLLRAGALSCALMTTTALTAPALAQSTDVPSPSRYAIDENGVDVARGEHRLSVTDVAIGPAGQGLAYVRHLRRTGGDTHNFDMGLFQNGSSWTATVGLESFAFSQVGTSFTSADGKGATLVQENAPHLLYRLRLPDGSEVVYDPALRASADSQRVARAKSVTSPGGEQTRLHWVSESWCSTQLVGCIPDRTAFRLQAVTNSYGYQLHFNYGRSDVATVGDVADWQRLASVTALNTQLGSGGEACDPIAHSCALVKKWPRAAYAGSAVTDSTNRTTFYTSSASEFRIRYPGSSVDDVIYRYGADDGRVNSVTRDGESWTYLYAVNDDDADPANHYLRMIIEDPNGNRRRIESDLRLLLPEEVTQEMSLQTADDNITTSYRYDTVGRLTRAQAPQGQVTEYEHDARGNLKTTRFIPNPAAGGPTLTTHATYPLACDDQNFRICNQPITTTDARGNVTSYEYAAEHGGLVTVTAPAVAAVAPMTGTISPQMHYDYAPFTLADGLTVRRLTRTWSCRTKQECATANIDDRVETVISYDHPATPGAVHPNLMVTGVTRRQGDGALSATTSYIYDFANRPLYVDGPLADTVDRVRILYNDFGEVIGRISPDPDGTGPRPHRAERFTYNSRGLLRRTEAGGVPGQSGADFESFTRLARMDFEYDGADRLVQRALYDADTGSAADILALEERSYDPAGRLSCAAVRMNPAAFDNVPDDACTPGAVQAGFGPDRITRFGYDRADRLTLIETGYGTAEAATEAAYSYSRNGQVATVTDGEGNRTIYLYDGLDRLKTVQYPSATTPGSSNAADYEQYGYDANGNVTSFTNRSGQTRLFDYDRLNRLTRHDRYNTTSDDSYTYDLLGGMTSATRGAIAFTFEHDALGRQTREAGPISDLRSEYDAAGRRTRLRYSASATGFNLSYDYLATGEVAAVRVNGAITGPDVAATYSYDDLGRRTRLVRGNGTVSSWDYDDASRLTSLTHNAAGTDNDLTVTFGYNPAGQIVTRTASNDAFAFTGHAGGSVTDTHNGLNQVVTSGGTPIDHSQRGTVIEIGASGYNYNAENQMTSTSTGVTLGYDALGRLYQVSEGGNVRRFIHDGHSIIGEYDGAGNYLHRYLHGPGVDELLAWDDRTSGSAIRRYAENDERGSVVAYTSTTGAVHSINRFDEHGQPQSGTVSGRFGYTGQPWLPELGMYYYRARIYNPQLARFMQPDPIGYGGGMNLYNYVGGDPVNLNDPIGLDPAARDDMPPPKCVGDFCAMTGTRIPFGMGGLCPSCSGYSIQMGMPNVAALVRRGDVSWDAAGVLTTYSDGTTEFDGTVSLGGGWRGATFSLGTGQFSSMMQTSWGVAVTSPMLHLASGTHGGGGASGGWDIPFAHVRDHWARHGPALRTESVQEYHRQAEANILFGTTFRFRIEGQQRLAHITRIGDQFMFTSTNLSETRIFTHMLVGRNYLSNKGITLPIGF